MNPKRLFRYLLTAIVLSSLFAIAACDTHSPSPNTNVTTNTGITATTTKGLFNCGTIQFEVGSTTPSIANFHIVTSEKILEASNQPGAIGCLLFSKNVELNGEQTNSWPLFSWLDNGTLEGNFLGVDLTNQTLSGVSVKIYFFGSGAAAIVSQQDACKDAANFESTTFAEPTEAASLPADDWCKSHA